MGKGRGRRRRRERERGPAYTYLAYSMIGRRLITIEIGSRVAIPTRVTAPARASTCIIKFTVIDLFTERPPPPSPSARVILASCVPGLGHHTMVVPRFSVSWKGRWEGEIGGISKRRICVVEICISLVGRRGCTPSFFTKFFTRMRRAVEETVPISWSGRR